MLMRDRSEHHLILHDELVVSSNDARQFLLFTLDRYLEHISHNVLVALLECHLDSLKMDLAVNASILDNLCVNTSLVHHFCGLFLQVVSLALLFLKVTEDFAKGLLAFQFAALEF